MSNQNKHRYRIICYSLLLLLISSLSFSQKVVLTGEIFDQSGNPVKSAFIKKQGTRFATISNKNGVFNFSLAKADTVLIISKKGYYDTVVHLKGEKSITIELVQIDKSFFSKDENQSVGGYGRWKDVNSSGSLSHFVLEKYHRSNKNLSYLLETMPGLTVRSKSGQPGAEVSVLSRGYESAIADQPLIIVDGVALNTGINMPNISPEISELASVNLKDVVHIEVLRDAASTSIFGSRGANGVIIIDTDRGKSKSFEVLNHTQFGVLFPVSGSSTMSPLPYFDLLNESLAAASLQPVSFPENPSAKDWQKEINRTGVVANHTISLRGGGEKSRFYLSGNINQTTGVLQNSNLLGGGVRINYSCSVSKWFDIQFNSSYSESRQASPVNNMNQTSSNPYLFANAYPPISKEEVQKIPELSALYGQYDPVELSDQQETKNNASFLTGGFEMKIKLSGHLTFHSKVGGNYSYYTKNALLLYPTNGSGATTDQLNSSEETSLYNWELNNYLKYQQLQGNSNWLFLLGSNELYLNTGSLLQYRVTESFSQANVPVLDVEGRNSRRTSALYTKLNYAYNERFNLSAGFRREKILNQEGVDQFGLFPSFSTGVWLKKPEANTNVIFSGVKLFLGWGVPGANRFYPINYYKTSVNGQYSAGETNATTPKYDPNTRWETTEEWNMGFQTNWLNSDLIFKLTYFDRMRDNVAYLTNENQINSTVPQWNYTGRVYNSGYELEFAYKKSFDNFGVFGSFNLQINSSKVVSLGESNGIAMGYYPQYMNGEIPINVFREGVAPGAFWGYLNEGVVQPPEAVYDGSGDKSIEYAANYPEPGDYRFKDLDYNGVIDENDMTVIGNPAPATTYFFSGGIVFSNFDFTFDLDGTTGGDILNLTKSRSESTGGYNNRSITMEGRWSELNPSGELARVHLNDPNNNNRIHSGMVENGSFFRFKKIELGYDFLSANGKKNRIYIAAHDFVSISPYSEGVPAFTGINNNRGVDFGIYPFSSTLLIGLQIGL